MNETESLPPWWVQWAVTHCTAFALGQEAAKSVLAWGPVFTRLFTADELHAATTALLASPTGPKWVDEHRKAIIVEVEAARARTRAARVAESARCDLCDGTGFMFVPHPGGRPGGGLCPVLRPPAEDPTGVNRELAVTCTCTVGQRTVDAEQARGRQPLTYLAYTRRYPNYGEVEYLRREIRWAGYVAPTDADYQNLAAALAARAKLPRRTA